MAWPKIFCWSKIGPEAGLTLDQIIRWKEFQRSLSGGVFVWGVGGIPGREKQNAFLKSVRKPRVLFSEQLGKARPDYENPSSTTLWTHFVDDAGIEVELPRYAAVTSKGGVDKHHAIMCYAQDPIVIQEDIGFDIGLFGNFQGSSNIAFQQPAPIVEVNKLGKPKLLYPRGFWADLARQPFVTLSQGRKLSRKEASQIRDLVSSTRASKRQFKQLIDTLKRR